MRRSARDQSERPHIGIDARRATWMPETGVGRYVSRLLEHRNVEQRLELVPIIAGGQAAPRGGAVRIRRPAGTGSAARVGWEQIALPLVEPTLGTALLHLPWYEGSPLHGQMVLTIHDLDSVMRPNGYPRRFLWYYNRLLPLLARRARRIVVPSEATADSLSMLGPRFQSKARVIPHGHDPALIDVRADRPLGGDMVLYSGGYAPRKRLDLVLESFRQAHTERRDLRLVMLGNPPHEVHERIAMLHLEGAIDLPGVVDQSELVRRYAHADALLYPSDWEGYGFPVLDAMTAGLPVVATRAGSIPETAGDCALLTTPGRAVELADALLEALDATASVRDRVERGRRRASTFTWTRTVRAHADLWLDALA